jgi:hypothetical protein
VSNAGLVLDLDGAQRGEQLLDEVVLLVVNVAPPRLETPRVRCSGRPRSSTSCQVEARAAIARSAIMFIAASRSRSSHSVPYGRR